MNNIEIKKYSSEYEEKWDCFVLNEAYNGTILQTRKFLNYHKDRFVDESLMFFKGGNTLIAVIPACSIVEDNMKKFCSHIGSTFGGIIISKGFYSISNLTDILDSFEEYIVTNDFKYALFKQTPEIFSKFNSDLLYYLLFQRNYESYDEISFVIDLKDNNFDYIQNMKSKTRNEYRSSLKNNLVFRQLNSEIEIEMFYNVLCKSLMKYNTKPVHSFEELLMLNNENLKNKVEFYGVFLENVMIAGSMVFNFGNVFHTQYLAADPNYLRYRPMDFMDGQLIKLSKERAFDYFSFGISTENHGKVFNESLAKFKEGFGTKYYINKSYYKVF